MGMATRRSNVRGAPAELRHHTLVRHKVNSQQHSAGSSIAGHSRVAAPFSMAGDRSLSRARSSQSVSSSSKTEDVDDGYTPVARKTRSGLWRRWLAWRRGRSEFAAHGADVCLSRRTDATLEATARRVAAEGGHMRTAIVDALDDAAVDDYLDSVAREAARSTMCTTPLDRTSVLTLMAVWLST